MLADTVGVPRCPHTMMVDDEGNPWSEHILVFLDAVVVLYRNVPPDPIEAAATDLEDGAITAGNYAPRLLMAIPRIHAHALRALWFAVVYLCIAYEGTSRGYAVDWLFRRVSAEWGTRKFKEQEREREREREMLGVKREESESERVRRCDEEWLERARRVETTVRGGKGWMGCVWAEMKGMVRVDELRARAGGEVGPEPCPGRGDGRQARLSIKLELDGEAEALPPSGVEMTKVSPGRSGLVVAEAAGSVGRKRPRTRLSLSPSPDEDGAAADVGEKRFRSSTAEVGIGGAHLSLYGRRFPP
jgi:hypothetical protein